MPPQPETARTSDGTASRTHERFFADPVRARRTGLALLGVVALMAVLVPAEPLAVDRRWSEAMRDVESALLEHIALVFNALGRGLGWALSLVAIGAALLLARRRLAFIAFAVAECAAWLIPSLLKALTGRPRRRRPWWTVATLGIVGMAWSRTYLQVHWLSDVVAGALLGIGIALLVFGSAQLLGRHSA